MLRAANCPFVLYVGAKKLVKRKEFEEYISNKLVIYELAVLRKESPFVIILNIAMRASKRQWTDMSMSRTSQ